MAASTHLKQVGDEEEQVHVVLRVVVVVLVHVPKQQRGHLRAVGMPGCALEVATQLTRYDSPLVLDCNEPPAIVPGCCR